MLLPEARGTDEGCVLEVGTGVAREEASRAAGLAAARAARASVLRHAPSLVLVFAAARHDLAEVLRGVREVTGDAPLAGATTGGEILDAEHDGSVVVTILASPVLRAHVGAGRDVAAGWEPALDAALRAPGLAPYFDGSPGPWGALTGAGESAFALLFSPGNTKRAVTRSFDLLEALKRRSLGRLPVFGGSAGDDWALEANHVLAGGEAIPDGVVVVVVETALEHGIAMAHALRPVGRTAVVTAAIGHEVLSLDDRPAADVCAELVWRSRESLEGAHVSLATGRVFGTPDLVGSFLPNVVSYFTARGGVLVTRPVCAGTELTLLAPDPGTSAGIDAVRKAMLRGTISEPAVALLAWCALRPRLVGNGLAGDELPALRRAIPGVPLVGFLSFGEQGQSDDGSVQHTNAVVGALVLGRRLSAGARVARENAALREELEGKAAALAAAREGLERAVAERTAELSTLNRKLREEVAERARAEALARRHLRALRTLTGCDEALVRATSEPALLDEVCRCVVESGGYRMCWVASAEQDADHSVRCLAQRGVDDGYLRSVTVRWDDSRYGRGPVGTAIRTGLPVVVRDMATDPTFSPWLAEAHRRGFASMLALPLTMDGAALGALAIYAAEVDAFADEAELRLLVDLSGNLAYGISTLRARAERAQLAARAMQSDRLAAVGTLAAGVAHEINNPLSYVLAGVDYAQQALTRGEPGAAALGEVAHVLEEIREGSERIRQVVTDLRTFARGDDVVATAVDLRRVLDTAVKMTWSEYRLRARVVKEYGEVPPVLAGEGRLGQVFVNLLLNAAQAIPEGRPDAHEIRLSTRRDEQGRVVVAVRDTGCGMPPGVLDRIFEPFFTTKPVGVGTGLGLSVCRNIVVALGGELRVASKVGEGTTFEVVLPATAAAPRAPDPGEAGAPPPPPPRPRARILVVDDEPQVLRALARALEEEGEVTCELDAREALARVTRGERFDVLLCDLMMPGMTGMELHGALARIDPRVAERVVFVTGGAFTPAARSFLERNGNPRVEKPFQGEALREIVRGLAAP